MVNFTALAATAQRLIEGSGRAVTLHRQNTTASNPAQPWRGPAATTSESAGGSEQSAVICFVPHFGSGLGRELLAMLGQSIGDIDQIGLLAADSVPDVDVETFDTVVDGGRAWTIHKVHRLQPADVVLLWVLQLKASGP